jgi:uncharacterized protein
MMQAMPAIVWKTLAVLFIVLGVIGAVLPVMPTVPFLLLAAASASRGWPWLDDKLTSHTIYGPIILRWRERGAVPRRAKWFATVGMSFGAMSAALAPVPAWVSWSVAAVMFVVGVWIWRRPEE